MIRTVIQSALVVSLGAAAFTATAPIAHAQEAGGLEQVFVTARKRDEGVQNVPIAMTALSNEVLDQHNIKVIDDLNVTIPGFRFGASGSKVNNDSVIRGLSKIPIGDGVPAVVTYFANVALPARGGNIGTYDLANIQVLKGPQGTLFGRNTIGGAIVITPVAPSYDLNGYVRGNYGTKDYRNLEGAINLPIVDDKVALRVAGQVQRQDGLGKNMSGGPDFSDTHNSAYRVSLLLNPTDNIENLTVYDHFQAKEKSAMQYFYRVNPSLAGLECGFNGTPPCPPTPLTGLNVGTLIADQIRAQGARSKAAGYHRGFTDQPNAGASDRALEGVSNDTSFDMGWATLRNIFGYRRVKTLESASTGASDPITLPYSFPLNTFTLFDATGRIARDTVSDELQLFGNTWDDRLDWITGYYFNRDKPNDKNGQQFTGFSLGGIPAKPVSGLNTFYNWALFGQVGLDISEWTVDGLKLNAGVRYAVDKASSCAAGADEMLDQSGCENAVAAGTIGAGTARLRGEDYSYTLGVDWQVNADTLVYLTHRRGYRAGIINNPIFNTFYTTGGNGPTLPAPTQPGATDYSAGCVPPGASSAVSCPDFRDFQTTDPETVRDVEVGIKNDWNIGDVKGRINVAAFYLWYDNAVEFLNASNAGIPTGLDPSSGSVGYNAADMTIKGLEMDLTVIPVPSLTLTLSGAYTDQDIQKVTSANVGGVNVSATDRSGIPEMAPNFTGTIAFSWVLPVKPLDGQLTFSGDYYHIDDFAGQGGTTEQLPGYSLANFRLAWTGIANSGLDTAIYVKNAFDKDYLSSAVVMVPQFPMAVAMVGDPRTWGVEATYKF